MYTSSTLIGPAILHTHLSSQSSGFQDSGVLQLCHNPLLIKQVRYLCIVWLDTSTPKYNLINVIHGLHFKRNVIWGYLEVIYIRQIAKACMWANCKVIIFMRKMSSKNMKIIQNGCKREDMKQNIEPDTKSNWKKVEIQSEDMVYVFCRLCRGRMSEIVIRGLMFNQS